MKRIGLIWISFWLASCGLFGQYEKVYNMLTIPATQRSLSLYRGQLQMNVGYLHGLGTQKYNSAGSRLSFVESAGTYLANDLSFQLSYGILDFIELSAAMDYIGHIESLATIMFWDGENLNEVNTDRQIRGPGLLDLFLTLKQPFFKSGFDFDLWGGFSIPVFSHTPSEPLHSISILSPSDPDSPYNLNYHYKFKPASNVSMWHAGFDTKLLFKHFALTGSGFYKGPTGAEQTYRWDHTLYGDQFTHMAYSYERLPAANLNFNFTPAYQAFPWFAISLSLNHHSEYGGWTEETGSRLAIPERSMGTISPGFEILVSALLRWHLNFDIPVYGKNSYAIYSIRSGLSINLVPFKSHYK